MMRHITPAGLELIKHYEGFSPVVYRCPARYYTIGYGHRLKQGEHFDAPISMRLASLMLQSDVAIAENAILCYIDAPLSDGQFDALTSFTYNLGAGALQRSTLRRKVNRREYEAAAEEFGRWVYAGGRKLPGLIKRRAAEAEWFMN